MHSYLDKRLLIVSLSFCLFLLTGCGSTPEPGNLALYSGNYSKLQAMPLEQLNPPNKSWKTDALLNASDQRHAELVSMLMQRGLKPGGYDLAAAICDVPLRQALAELSPFWDGSVNRSKRQRSAVKTLKALLSQPIPKQELDAQSTYTIGYTDKYGPYTSHYNFRATPLGIAARWGSLEEVKLLLESGASVTTDDVSALHIAAYYHRIDVVKLLIEKGADVNATTKYRWCDLSQRRFTEAFSGIGDEIDGMRFCLDKGATPLMFAAATLSMDAAKLLVSAGADLGLSDDKGKTVDNYSGEFVRIQQRAQKIDHQRKVEEQESSFDWGKLFVVAAGNAYAASQLNATQFSQFSSAFTRDVMSGTTSNMQSLTNQLRQEQAAAQTPSTSSNNGGNEGPTINESFPFTCPSGDSYTETIQAKSRQCADAMKTYLRAAGCNLVDEMQQAEKAYYSACASEMY